MRKKISPQRAIILLLIALLFFIADYYTKNNSTPLPSAKNSTAIEQAYNNKKESVQVMGRGVVVKILPDDLHGAKHQKFIIKISKDLTILIAHNIDLAPRINSLKKGDEVIFNGEYEYNNKGGVVHWTHHDPRKKHPEGWLKHKGKTYK
ncbi:DUF3465 domain-containing protein [Desulforhopalus sp. 52FAK]